jgi:3-oxoacyl-[acyl-carrier-protein] synthase II
MASSSRRAVITGLGVLTPVGAGQQSFWQGLLTGKSGVRTIRAFDPSALPTRIAGEVPDFDPKNYIAKENRRALRMMARTVQLAVSAAQMALDDAQIDKAKLDPTRFGVEFGSGLIATELDELLDAARLSANCQPGVVDLEKWGETGLRNIQPLWMLKYLPNMLACHVSIFHNAQGPSNTITEGDVASLLAIGEAFRILSRDGADFFLVGGGDSRINPLSLVRNCLFQPLSRRNEAPERASRPFDRDRDGLVLGEGSAVLAMEELEHAKKRGAKIYAEILGFGSAFDPQRSGQGLARAIRAAMTDAGIGPEEVDHINAHGQSTAEGDLFECRALMEIFGNVKPAVPVFAAKSYMGSLGASNGTVETAASALAMTHGVVPPTLNYETPDPAIPLNVIAREPRSVRKPYFVKVGFTEHGQCGALVGRKWE